MQGRRSDYAIGLIEGGSRTGEKDREVRQGSKVEGAGERSLLQGESRRGSMGERARLVSY